ncbi:MAG TPA: TIGR02266 family protein, partial [Myxococcaceae bacterium]|nr:TIGR02266 family protein [Myxococcaceae bacterium]
MSNAPEGKRRRYPRARVPLLVQYRFNRLEDFTAEYAQDLSPGGLFLRTDLFRPVGTRLSLQFSLKDGSALIEVSGRVAFVSPAGNPSRPPGMGIEFLEVDPGVRAQLETLCRTAPP